VSVLQKTEKDVRAKRRCYMISGVITEHTVECTCVATYAREPAEMAVIPWSRALPDLVAFTSFSTELGEVKMCLYACPLGNKKSKSRRNRHNSLIQEGHF